MPRKPTPEWTKWKRQTDKVRNLVEQFEAMNAPVHGAKWRDKMIAYYQGCLDAMLADEPPKYRRR